MYNTIPPHSNTLMFFSINHVNTIYHIVFSNSLVDGTTRTYIYILMEKVWFFIMLHSQTTIRLGILLCTLLYTKRISTRTTHENCVYLPPRRLLILVVRTSPTPASRRSSTRFMYCLITYPMSKFSTF